MVTVYSPGCRFDTLKWPSPPVVAVSSLLVPVFFTVTEAPGMTSLLGLVTTPPMAPVTVDCAIALMAQIATISTEMIDNFRDLHISGELLRDLEALRPFSRN